MDLETIVAIATPPGPGGVGIVRLSGTRALAIGQHMTQQPLRPRHAHYCSIYSDEGDVLDSGICLFFPGPRSFTGEDIVELQAHGGPVVLDLIVRETHKLGARQALPGEFSQRAYLNDKIDLTQAEAIADLINSSSQQAARNASRSLQGAFSQKIHQLVEQVTQLRVFIEAAIDFPEEEIDFIDHRKVSEALDNIIQQFDIITAETKQGTILQEGMKLVIAGKPNAGKSSLLNALSGQNTAIVTATEGTTRDVLRALIQIDGLPVHIADTAGLRDSDNAIEQEGIRRARLEIETADHVLLVIDNSVIVNKNQEDNVLPSEIATLARHIPITRIYNKSDLTKQTCHIDKNTQATSVYLSAKTGDGISLLKEHLKHCMGYDEQGSGNFSARRRHLQSLEQAREALLDGKQQLLQVGAAELLAEDLRLCQNSLGEITGTVSSDDLLGTIFSSFCIGK